MEDRHQLENQMRTHTEEMLGWLDGLTEAQFQQRPVEGKWSVLEHLEHLFVAEKGAARLFQQPAEPIARDWAASGTKMQAGLADLNVKFAGGSQIDPKGRFQSYGEWRPAFISNREDQLRFANSLGWDGHCVNWPHPFFGTLTRAEWVLFNMLHANRHVAQIKHWLV